MKKDIFIKCAIITFIALTICVIIAASTMTGNIIYEPQHDTLHLTKLIPTLFVNIVAALVTSAIISGVLSKSVSGKYSNALYSENINKADTEEASVEEMSADIKDALDHLRYERNKIEYILDNMSEGLVLISSDKTVRTLNSAAQRVLGCDERENGKSIDCYTNNLDIIEGVDKCREGIAAHMCPFETILVQEGERDILGRYIAENAIGDDCLLGYRKYVKDESTVGIACMFYEKQGDIKFYHSNPFFNVTTVSNDDVFLERSTLPF